MLPRDLKFSFKNTGYGKEDVVEMMREKAAFVKFGECHLLLYLWIECGGECMIRTLHTYAVYYIGRVNRS